MKTFDKSRAAMKCEWCGEEFHFPNGERHRRKYCSAACSGKGTQPPGFKRNNDWGSGECLVCDEVFPRRSSTHRVCSECCPPSEWGKWNHRIRRYGIGKKKFDLILDSQGGVCAICMESAPTAIDHHHGDGGVRGLLCDKCNYGMHFVDDEQWLKRALEYACERI